jgi:hypothetical protein
MAGPQISKLKTRVRSLSGRSNTIVKTSTGARSEITDLLYANLSLDYDIEAEPAKASCGASINQFSGCRITIMPGYQNQPFSSANNLPFLPLEAAMLTFLRKSVRND